VLNKCALDAVCACTHCRWANQQQVIGSDGKLHGFQHPVVFTLLMFLGEFLCFAVFKVIRLISNRRGVSSNAGWFIIGKAFVFKELLIIWQSYTGYIRSG